jgi:hypothetical protein
MVTVSQGIMKLIICTAASDKTTKKAKTAEMMALMEGLSEINFFLCKIENNTESTRMNGNITLK